MYEVIYGNPEHFLRPHFQFPINNVPLVTANWPRAGDEIVRITATSPSRSAIHYELYADSEKARDYFAIDPDSG